MEKSKDFLGQISCGAVQLVERCFTIGRNCCRSVWGGSAPSLCTVFLLVAGIILLSIVVVRRFGGRKSRTYPPGPPGILILGGLLFTNWRSQPMFKQTAELARKYGKIFSVRLGRWNVVILHDLDDVKEVMNKEEAQGRWRYLKWHQLYYEDNIGIIVSEGAAWRANRRFCLRNLREFGFGKASKMEVMINDEVRLLVDELKRAVHQDGSPSLGEIQRTPGVGGSMASPQTTKEDTDDGDERRPRGVAVELDEQVQATMINTLWQIIASKRCSGEDEEFKRAVEAVAAVCDMDWTVFASMVLPPSAAFFGGRLPVPGFLYNRRRLHRNRETLFDFVKKVIAEHESTFQPGGDPRDLTDAFLAEQAQSDAAAGTPDHLLFTDVNLCAIMIDMFAAGMDTMSATLKWIFLLLIHHPEIQQKVHSEVDQVIGRERSPTWEDNASMPYTQAVIHEVWRYVTIAGTIQHRLLKDVKLHNFLLPKGTVVEGHLYSLHHDAAHWPNPDKFDPNRFLTEDPATGELQFVKQPGLIPFGVGKRVCPGESFARMTVFLTFAHLMQAFEFAPVPTEQYRLDSMPTSGLINRCYPYKVLIVPRMHAPPDQKS